MENQIVVGSNEPFKNCADAETGNQYGLKIR